MGQAERTARLALIAGAIPREEVRSRPGRFLVIPAVSF